MSFSKDRDNLSKWRAYARDGAGFAIGCSIIYDDDRTIHADHDLLSVVSAITYDRNEFEHVQNDLIQAAIKLIESPEDRTSASKAVDSCLAAYLLERCVFYKHFAFSEKEETRLLVCNLYERVIPHVRTREVGNAIVSYVPLRINDTINITEIVVGPAAPEDTEMYLEDLLRTKNYGHVQIDRSDIPYKKYG
jgi:hypothetical protein